MKRGLQITADMAGIKIGFTKREQSIEVLSRLDANIESFAVLKYTILSLTLAIGYT